MNPFTMTTREFYKKRKGYIFQLIEKCWKSIQTTQMKFFFAILFHYCRIILLKFSFTTQEFLLTSTTETAHTPISWCPKSWNDWKLIRNWIIEDRPVPQLNWLCSIKPLIHVCSQSVDFQNFLVARQLLLRLQD